MIEELKHHLKALTRLIYYVTDEEDRFIVDFHQTMKDHEKSTWVFNAALGLVPIANLRADWKSRAHTGDQSDFHSTMIKIYQDDPKQNSNFYIITDPERWLKDGEPHMHRRVMNVIHQVHQELRIIKVLIFVGPRRMIPDKLARYFTIINDPGLNNEEVKQVTEQFCHELKTEVPADPPSLFRGLNSYEIEEIITRTAVIQKSSGRRRIDPEFVAAYRRDQLKKTDLLQFVDTSQDSFDKVGGADRFKAWAKKTKACWTPEGRAFGLKPPKGVLLVGVYGCGKSISVKAMANEWGLPIVQFELGKLMSSGVGDSEGNLYRALRLVESVAPCVMWIDEAEKSLSGGASSAQSDAGTTSRVLGILSTWVQETSAPVSIAMTANSLKTLPVEMTNRMPERFFFDLPTEEERIDIIKIHARKNNQDTSSFPLADLADKAKNLVGRELMQSIETAMVDSYHAGKKGLDADILGSVLERKPRIIRTMTDEIQSIITWVGYDPDVDDGVRARLASSQRSEQFKLIGEQAKGK